MSEKTHRDALPTGYRLHWYVIDKVLGQGGFGITYLARDENLHQPVAIKEYLPRELAGREQDDSVRPLSGEQGEQFRWGLDRFISEARTLAQFRHANIVRVLAVFEENNTAYMVMEYEQGEALHEVLTRRKTLEEPELLRILMPLLDGLAQVHAAGFIHRDIKPPNIYLRANGSPVLLDFGSARQALSEQTRTLTSMVSPGYAPFEQYTSKGDKQGPWTDIYGLGAMLYRAVTGRGPGDAMDRSEALLHTGRDIYVSCAEIGRGRYSTQLLGAIDRALAFKPQDRPQSIAEWRQLLPAETTAPPTTVTQRMPPPPTAGRAKPVAETPPTVAAVTPSATQPSRWRWLGYAAGAVLLGMLLIKFVHWRIEGALEHALNTPAEATAPGNELSAPATAAAPTANSEPAVTAPAAAPAANTAESRATPAVEAPHAPANAPDDYGERGRTVDASKSLPWQHSPQTAAPESPSATESGDGSAATRNLSRKEVRERVQKMEELGRLAKQAAARGDYTESRAYLDEALRLAPNSPRIREARAQLDALMREHEQNR